MKRNILILEDKEIHMKNLHSILDEMPDVEVFEAYNIAEAYCMLFSRQIHLFLIDIVISADDSSDVSGLDFVRNLRQNDKYKFAPVIFVTSLEDPKLISYSELHCYGYIEKPFDKNEVKRLIAEVLSFPVKPEEDKPLYYRIDGIIYSVNTRDLIYMETRYRKLEVHTTKDKLAIPYKTLNEAEKDLDMNTFLQCNRTTIINKKYVEQVDTVNRYIKLSGVDGKIEIGRAFIKKVREVFEND